MTSELLTVCAVGVAPAGLILTSHRALVQCLERPEDRLTAVENRLATVEREQAHPVGLLARIARSHQRPSGSLSLRMEDRGL